MFKKTILATFILFLLIIVAIIPETKALTFEELPVKQTSKQWSVQIDKADQGKGLAKPEKGKFHTYSLEVNNIGKDVFSAEVNLFRNEPNSRTKFSLVGCPDGEDCNKNHYAIAKSRAKPMNNGIPYKFTNFLLAEKATELEVEIVWTEDSSGRPLKETFTFTAE